MATRRVRRNGFWLKVAAAIVSSLFVLAIAGSVAWAWSTNGRVVRNETSIKTIGELQKEMRDDIKDILRYVKPRDHP